MPEKIPEKFRDLFDKKAFANLATWTRPEGTLVATDDNELGARARALGAASVRSRQLIERFARQHASAPAVGHARPTPPAATTHTGQGDDGPGDDERRPWKPGRGATRKRGNPKRGHGGG